MLEYFSFVTSSTNFKVALFGVIFGLTSVIANFVVSKVKHLDDMLPEIDKKLALLSADIAIIKKHCSFCLDANR